MSAQSRGYRGSLVDHFFQIEKERAETAVDFESDRILRPGANRVASNEAIAPLRKRPIIVTASPTVTLLKLDFAFVRAKRVARRWRSRAQLFDSALPIASQIETGASPR